MDTTIPACARTLIDEHLVILEHLLALPNTAVLDRDAKSVAMQAESDNKESDDEMDKEVEKPAESVRSSRVGSCADNPHHPLLTTTGHYLLLPALNYPP
ncbi:MAG: hypothetical protein Q9168_001686 [Polycauliona sp. 1 TL-2023]